MDACLGPGLQVMDLFIPWIVAAYIPLGREVLRKLFKVLNKIIKRLKVHFSISGISQGPSKPTAKKSRLSIAQLEPNLAL